MEIEIGMAMEIIFGHEWKLESKNGKYFEMELEIRMEKLSQEWNYK